jgi:signal transduction histidine kinase
MIIQASVDAVAHLTGAETVAFVPVLEKISNGDCTLEFQSPILNGRRDSKSKPTGIQNLNTIPPVINALEKKERILLVPGDKNDVYRMALLTDLLKEKINQQSLVMLQPVFKEDENLGLLLIKTADDKSWVSANNDTVDLLVTQLINGLALVRYQHLLDEKTTFIEKLRKGAAQSQKLAAKLDKVVGHQRTKIESLEEMVTRIEAIREYKSFTDQKEKDSEERAYAFPRPAIEYIAHMAQEVRRPVASILGYSELLLGGSGGKLGELQLLFLERIKAGSEKIVLLIEDLISVVAPDWTPFLVNLKPVNVTDLIEEVIDDFSNQLDLRGIELKLMIDPNLPKLELDPDKIRQIVFCLFNNTLHSSPINRKMNLEVTYQQDSTESTDTENQRGYLFITMSDAGVVEEPDDEMILSGQVIRVERPLLEGIVDSAEQLSHVKDLVQVHGGRVWVEEEPDVSCTLRLVLPASVAA